MMGEFEILDRPWFDALLLFALGAFFLYEGILLWRSTRLGWAMTAKCAALSYLFFLALILPLLSDPWATRMLVLARIAVIVAVVWAVRELRAMRRRRQSFVIREDDNPYPVDPLAEDRLPP